LGRLNKACPAMLRIASLMGTAVFGAKMLARVEAQDEPRRDRRPLRILVTGFHDWRDLGPTPNLWRCRDNPSCRLILGKPSSEPSIARSGELTRRLRELYPRQEVEWTFETLRTYRRPTLSQPSSKALRSRAWTP
jgi:hypothetical protein